MSGQIGLSGEMDQAEARWIDAELRELQSFVIVETGHLPTAGAVNKLRFRVAAAFGHDDVWCVEHCHNGGKHELCECACHQGCRPEVALPGGTP